MPPSQPLSPELQREAFRRIAAWQAEPTVPVACPECHSAGLLIEDRSARPHAEWFALSCQACGLSTTLHRPMGAPVPGAS